MSHHETKIDLMIKKTERSAFWKHLVRQIQYPTSVAASSVKSIFLLNFSEDAHYESNAERKCTSTASVLQLLPFA
jgi:hypothetical protein